MPLRMLLTPNALAGRKFYYDGGQMPLTFKLQILMAVTQMPLRKCSNIKNKKKNLLSF